MISVRFYNTLTQQVEDFSPDGWQDNPHVYVRPDSIQLCPYRQPSNVYISGCSAAVAEGSRLYAEPRDEHHGR